MDGVLEMPVGRENTSGWIASNDQQTKFWRVTKIDGNNDFSLNGPATPADFAPENVLRLWEYGVGDSVRLASVVSVRRIAPGQFEVTGNVDVEIVLSGKSVRITTEQLAKGPVSLLGGK